MKKIIYDLILLCSINIKQTQNLLNKVLLKNSINISYIVKVFAICLLIITMANNTKAQVANQVLWVKADKGVNSSTGVPAATNTQITTWYDQATTDGSQNGGIPTVDPGQPEANLPALPYYKYSSSATDNFNHNPVINFSYLNYGNAVQFTTPALGSQTVFTVFRAAGTGYYYDAMLLYGGDISNPSAGDPAPERADMAFSVWNTSRLNVWGGSVADFYGLGNLKLETQISIGTLKRNRVSDENVTHSIYGNGSTDILDLNADPDNSRTGEGRYLSGMVRIGKHFSCTTVADAVAARLNGQFAELMVYNTVLSDADRAKVESYLAVKYGITLTGGTRQLGSTIGNSNYDYVNSSGNIIRASDATYKYDVFGLGRDDYFGLDQRISKSNNTNDILTASTNSNFTSLNLDKTRTAIDGDKEFMLFANNKGSSDIVNTQTTELPTDVTSRLDREWKVNYFNTDGTNIKNVSLKFDLSGFTFTGATIDNLMLLIDTDGDGDFTTGTISKIPASAFVSSSYVSFDNINLTTANVFTLGIVSYTDSDGDGVPDYLDLDDDNDGILDTTECPTIKNNPVYHLFPASTLWLYKNKNGIGSSIVCITNNCSTAPNGTLYFNTNITSSTQNLAYDDGKYYMVNSAGDLLYTNDILDVPFTSLGNAHIGTGYKNLGYDNGVFYHWEYTASLLSLYSSTDPVNSGWTLMGTVINRPYSYTASNGITYVLKDIAVNNGEFYFLYYYSNAGGNTMSTANYTSVFTSFNPVSPSALWVDKGSTYFGSNVMNIAWGSEDILTVCDTDGDTIPDYLDLDSDNDGCPDAIEGGANFTNSDLVNSAMLGGNSSATSGTYNQPVIQNLGNNVGNTVTTMGVPTIAGTGQSIGDSQNFVANSQCTISFCYKPATTTGTTLDTNHGITALGRAGANNDNWPMIRKGAWTALEAKTKGFVVNRITTTASVEAIPNPVEGMMVYDEEADCLKINTDGTTTGWKCFNTQACPD